MEESILLRVHVHTGNPTCLYTNTMLSHSKPFQLRIDIFGFQLLSWAYCVVYWNFVWHRWHRPPFMACVPFAFCWTGGAAFHLPTSRKAEAWKESPGHGCLEKEVNVRTFVCSHCGSSCAYSPQYWRCEPTITFLLVCIRDINMGGW